MPIPENIAQIKETISQRQSQSSYDEPVSLMAVTKYYTFDQINAVIDAGLRLFGENKVQSAIEKMDHFKDVDITWHMIGHLQTNKVKKAVGAFDCIQSVDSLKVLEKINAEAALINKKMPILLQLNIAHEEGKYGFRLEQLYAPSEEALLDNVLEKKPGCFFDHYHVEKTPFLDRCFAYEHCDIQGVMVILPIEEDKKNLAQYFRTARRCCDDLKHRYGHHVNVLSMGMSDDFDVAIQEGATLIRLGRSLI